MMFEPPTTSGSPSPTSVSSNPPAPLVRCCHDVISFATQVTAAIDPLADLPVIRAVNPELATALGPLLDAVIELDYRTGILDQPGLPRPV